MLNLILGLGWPFNGLGIVAQFDEQGFVVLLLGPLYLGIEWGPLSV